MISGDKTYGSVHELYIPKNENKEECRDLYGIIYRIINLVDNKTYVGKAVKSFHHRYSGGQWWKYTHCKNLRQDYERLGHEAFRVDIFAYGYNDEDLCELERFLVFTHNSLHPNGYNLVGGGRKRREVSLLTRQRMSDAKIRLNLNPETKTKTRAHTQEEKDRQRILMTGRKYSEEVKEKQRIAASKRTDQIRAVLQIDGVSHQVIGSFKSLRDAYRATGVPVTRISECALANHLKTANGYIWRYADNPDIPNKLVRSKIKSVSQIEIDTGKILAIFPSARQAALRVNGSRGAICEVCRGDSITHKGFKWKYTNETT